MRFRPCIDLHEGKVKQIVGSSLRDGGTAVTNYVSAHSPSYFAEMYYADGLSGGHVIMLGKGNEAAAREALAVRPGSLQVGGGMTPDNAREWLDAGAGKVIVTSYLFTDGALDFGRVSRMADAVSPEKVVIDLSCVPVDGEYHVACNRWQSICRETLSAEIFVRLAEYCSEFLVHAVQVEGKQSGIDRRLCGCLAEWCPLPVTYAGGVRGMEDVLEIGRAGRWKVDFTVGSALDIFGGNLAYRDLAAKGEWTCEPGCQA